MMRCMNSKSTKLKWIDYRKCRQLFANFVIFIIKCGVRFFCLLHSYVINLVRWCHFYANFTNSYANVTEKNHQIGMYTCARTHARTQRWFYLPFYFTWINVKFLTIFVAWVVFRGCQLLSFFWIHLLVLVNVNALHFVYLPLAHTKTNEHRTTYAWINKINAKKLRKHNAIF